METYIEQITLRSGDIDYSTIQLLSLKNEPQEKIITVDLIITIHCIDDNDDEVLFTKQLTVTLHELTDWDLVGDADGFESGDYSLAFMSAAQELNYQMKTLMMHLADYA